MSYVSIWRTAKGKFFLNKKNILLLTHSKFEKDEIDNIMTLRDHVETTSLKLDKLQPPQREHLANTSFEQFCHGIGASPKALLTARVWCRGTTGQDPSDVSALAYLEVCRGAGGIVKLRHDGKDGAQYVRLKEGTQSIAVEMSKLLPSDAIELNTPVATVAKVPGDMYRVTATDDQIFTGRKVVVSVPSPAYKHIAFNPRLPQTKTQYTASARYGCFVKYICLFKTPFWRAKGACGLTQSFCGPMNHCRDTSVDDEGNHALTCFLCAGPGREWLALGKDARQQVVFQQLASLFATSYKDIKAQFLDDMTSEWTEDLWTGWGCPFPVTPPGVMTNAEVEKEADGVFFVGTEFAEEWRGYMEGALRSGKDGAERVLRGLGR